MTSLIEGLPDAIALHCLARAPLGMHRVMRAVCRSWRHILSSDSGELFALRRRLGLLEDWLFVTSFEPDRVWEAYDPVLDSWHTLPEFPSTVRHLSNFGTASLSGKLFVVGGGSDDVDSRTGERDCQVAIDSVWCFDVHRGKWERRAPLISPRTQFACCAVDGKILIAGGFSCSRRPLATAEVYDPVSDTWSRVADLAATHNSACSGVVLHGRMHVLHKGEAGGQVYDPGTSSWSLLDSWAWEFQGPMAVVKGELYTVANAYFYVMKGEVGRPVLCRMWHDYIYRIGYGVAAIGSNLYVVGGILGPRPESIMIHILKDVDIWNVDNDFLERRGTRMNWCSGTVLGCAAVTL